MSAPNPATGYGPLQHFAYEHITSHAARDTSKKFHDLVQDIVNSVSPGPERSVALRQLLIGKDAAVRAVMFPGS